VSKPHRFPIRVYYEDTDFTGNVYHAAYLHFMERARTEFLRAEGIHHSELIAQGLAFAVRTMRLEFEAAAHIDDMLEIATRVLAVTGARLVLEQTVTRGGTVLARAELVVVAIRTDGRPARMPEAIRARFGPSA
jgi:acyl-CoA thioester hydrolase